MHVYHGNIAFDLGMSEHRVSGTGTFSNPVSGTTTTMTASASDPLTMKLADGTANARANACAHSFHGAVQLSVAGSDGTLASQWRFASDSSTVAVTGATFTTPGGQSTAIPDTSVDLGCDGANNINDWVGRYQIRWACLPAEFGEFTTRITVKNSTTVSMLDDEDTPDEAYEATVIGTSARAIRGFFIDGPDGGRYREDFNWTLNPNGSGFSQTSRYRYIEGTQVASAASASRVRRASPDRCSLPEKVSENSFAAGLVHSARTGLVTRPEPRAEGSDDLPARRHCRGARCLSSRWMPIHGPAGQSGAASTVPGARDFDFELGSWRVHHGP
jgi:hypothetical protein